MAVANRNLALLHRSMSAMGWQHCRLSYSSTATDAEPRPVSEIPGLRSYPVIGSALGILSSDYDPKKIHLFMDNLMNRFGHIVKMTFPGQSPTVAVSRPEDIAKVYRLTMDDPVRQGFFSLKKIRYEMVNDYFEKKGGLLVENHEEWFRVRSKVQVPLMRPKNLIRHLPQMDEIALTFMDRIAALQEEFGEMPESFLEEIYKWALESVALVAVNKRLGCLEKNLPSDSNQVLLINTVSDILESMTTTEMNIPWWKLFPTPTFNKLKKSHDIFLRIVEQHFSEAVAELNLSEEIDDQQEMTLLETLLRQDGLTRKDVITLILDMFFAGIDTTSHTLGFTLYLLAKNPSAQRRLQEEVDSVLGDGKETITESHLARLSYLKACVKETMRIFPLVVGNARILLEDAVLGGYLVPKGYQIFTTNMYTSRNEAVFPRAKEFLPERWGRDKPLGPIHPFASLPFSHGTRMCIGRRIAEQEMYTFLARVMHRFNVSYKYEVIDLDCRMVSMPSEPLKFEFSERRTTKI